MAQEGQTQSFKAQGNLIETVPKSFEVAKDVIAFVMQNFDLQLKVNHLKKYLPQFNTAQVHSLNKECVSYFYLIPDQSSKNSKIHQDFMPVTNISDSLIQYHMKIQETQASILQKSKQFSPHKDSFLQTNQKFNSTHKSARSMQDSNILDYSLSKSQNPQISNTLKLQEAPTDSIQQTPSQVQVNQFKEVTQKKLTQESSLELNRKQLNSSDLLPLNLKADPVDPALQTELQHIKKHLYTMRRYRKIGIEQERQRLDNLAKKRSHLFFNKASDHTYEYDGSVLELNKLQNTKELLQQVKPTLLRNSSQRESLRNKKNSNKNSFASTSLEETENNSLFTSKADETNPERQLTSQQQAQKASFSNGNKRQISHLPFISLKQNTKVIFLLIKMIENKKQLSGSTTLRSSLNRSKISEFSSENQKFKSFAQIEQEKRLQKTRQKVLELTESQSNEMFVDILPPTLNLNPNSEPLRKQSKMMQKYLRKLTEQKSRIEKFIENDGKKSINFQQLKVPQKYPIQRYYEYDYEEDKQNYEYQITSKLSSSKRGSINETEFN